MKPVKDERIRSCQRAIRQMRVTIAVKTLCFALPLMLAAVVFSVIWLTEEAPSQWRTETVVFRQVRRVSAGRGSSMNWFVTMDDRRFATTRQVIDAVDDALKPGARCEVTHRQRLGTRSICGLTSDGTVFVDREQKAAEWEADRAEFLLTASVMAGLAILSAALSYGPWCRWERQEIVGLRAQIARRERRNSGD